MKSAGSTVAKDTKKAVQGQFSHFYRVMGDKAQGQSGNVLAMMQRASKDQARPEKKK